MASTVPMIARVVPGRKPISGIISTAASSFFDP